MTTARPFTQRLSTVQGLQGRLLSRRTACALSLAAALSPLPAPAQAPAETIAQRITSPACPLGRLVQQLSKPTSGLSMKEIPAASRGSTEGSVWQLRLNKAGAMVSATRTHFGEGGQRRTTFAPLDRNNFAIRSVLLTYREPIDANRPAVIVTEESADYFYCGDIVYVPVRNAEPGDALSAVQHAQVLRGMFLGATELAPHLLRLGFPASAR